MAIINYDAGVKKFLNATTDTKAKADIIKAYDYLYREFANELAIANRDYDLGLSDSKDIRKIQIKAYAAENKIRGYLGLAALPEINNSVL